MPDFETALAVGSNMMLHLYPDRWLLRGSQAKKNCLPSPQELGVDANYSYAQVIVAKGLSAIHCNDNDPDVRRVAHHLWDLIPTPFRPGGKKGWEGVELD